jgi:uncharacterized membrane protein
MAKETLKTAVNSGLAKYVELKGNISLPVAKASLEIGTTTLLFVIGEINGKTFTQKTVESTVNAAGYLAGAKAGAAIGASLGSVMPGVGTGIGAAIGALVGGMLGSSRATKIFKAIF